MTTNETKHTPGPWKVAGHGNGKQELPIYGPSGEIACIRGEAHLADARLIAAAPELLAALQYVSRLLGDGYSGPVVLRNATDADRAIFVSTVNAAIAKATGQN
jgi:hypothetical protein